MESTVRDELKRLAGREGLSLEEQAALALALAMLGDIPMGNRPSPANIGDLKAAADRLAEALRGVDEEDLLREFRARRR